MILLYPAIVTKLHFPYFINNFEPQKVDWDIQKRKAVSKVTAK